MKSKHELKQFFDQEILPDLPSETMLHSAKMFLPIFGGFSLLSWILLDFHLHVIFGIAFTTFVALFWWYVTYVLPKIEQKYQRLVINPMLNAIDPTMRHIPNRGIRETQIKDSRIIPDKLYNTMRSSNLISYQNDSIPVTLSHVELTAKKNDDDDSTPFQGLFAVTEARRSIKGTTIILFDVMEKHLGFVGGGLQLSSLRGELRKIRLDSSGFEKQYLVYSSDPIEANYLLTFTVMEKLTQLIAKYGLYPVISFVKDKIYIAIMEPSFLRSNGWNFEGLEPSLNALGYTLEAIEAIHHHHRL
ncbi:MAG: DUF3137 domain-containing protein [Campylobacterales bacterium]|nr:DUF3137 domain-containing protein [Campylobacterales bacterium]